MEGAEIVPTADVGMVFQQEISNGANCSSEEKKEEREGEEPKDTAEIKLKKFTLKDADDELRLKWKTLSLEEKETWKTKAKSAGKNDSVTITPDDGQRLSSMVLEVSDGESTPMLGPKRKVFHSSTPTSNPHSVLPLVDSTEANTMRVENELTVKGAQIDRGSSFLLSKAQAQLRTARE